MRLPGHLRSIVDHDGAVILDIERDQFFSMNSTGTYIWQRLLNGEGTAEIAVALAAETGEDLADVITDVSEFLENLKCNRLFGFQR